ncbi:SHOCT domain-containing protein [Viridibacillus arvi]|uniref:SHOCT domain-containing protein n=1 Tax=Viridibacillus arvi TaxID=263475 RepID=UPI003D291462
MGTGVGCLGMIFFAFLLFSVASGSEDLSTGFFWFCLIGIGASAFGGLIFDVKRQSSFADEIKKKLKDTVKTVENFNGTQEFTSPNLESYIAIDEDNKKVCIIENKHKNTNSWALSKSLSKFDYKYYVYSFDEIIQSEIIKDGVTINKTSRGSQIGGAIIGGALAGGVGAIIGGLGGSSESTSVVNKLELQIAVNNAKKSSYKVIFKSPYDLGEFITGDEEEKINHWYNLLTLIINRTDENVVSEKTLPSTYVSDELKKLAELKHDGILTEEEFKQQKQKLLSS